MITKNKKQFITKTNKEKQEEINTILKSLEDGVKGVYDSDKYKRYLEFCAKFHHYSFNNTLLILMQCPKAQKCASYATWKKLNMPVKRGEKGIRILVPVPYSYVKEDNCYETEEENEDQNNRYVVSGIRFRIGHVFDISQVEGTMPSLANELTDNPEHLNILIEKMIKNSPTPIIYDPGLTIDDGNGYYDLYSKTIALRTNMSSLQTLKTLIHEIAHSIMHGEIDLLKRREEEIQAESVAYVVCSALGLDTSEYSFEYIAAWSKSKEVKELKSSLVAIEKGSKEILSWLDGLVLD